MPAGSRRRNRGRGLPQGLQKPQQQHLQAQRAPAYATARRIAILAVIKVAEPEAAPATASVRARPKAAAKQTAAAKAQKRNHLRRALRLNEILSEPERRVLLSRIARGQICGTRYLVVKGNLIEKPVPARGGQRLGCIIELNKMKGAYPLQQARKKSAAKY